MLHLLGLDVQQAMPLDEIAAARPLRQPLVVDGDQRELRRHLGRRVRIPAHCADTVLCTGSLTLPNPSRMSTLKMVRA